MARGLLLCGGHGRRLWPYTDSFPKSLMPLLDRPLLTYTIERFRDAGITQIMVNSLTTMSDLQACLGDGSAWGVELTYVQEPFQLGTAGILHHAKEFWEGDDLVVSVADMVSTLSISDLLEFHRSHDQAATVACIEHPWPLEEFHGDVVVLGEGTRAVEYQLKPKEKAKSRLAGTGAWVLNPRVQPHLQPPDPAFADRDGVDLNRDLLPRVVDHPDLGLHAYVSKHLFDDFGLAEGYIEGSLLALEGDMGIAPITPANGRGQHLASSAVVGDGVELEGAVLVERDAVIGDGAKLVGPCVIGPAARVGAGAVVRDSVVLPGGAVADGAVVLHSLVGSMRTPDLVREYYWQSAPVGVGA
ncbi:sugar phosphate nucleotidyltransferase [Pedococcus sp. 2YAF34]|uniref:sugar phosphate nucleotidyltransferase n=1 Tax=Pedococcus sp. 2YAF34 TaxID=3233032 RepID=UPI003F984DDD